MRPSPTCRSGSGSSDSNTERDDSGVFGPGTAAAVQAFQSQRGLRTDGVCGTQTWSSLVEAGFRLGDRLLYRRSPMLQGDDIAEVQRRLSGLGFDPGGVDGIFGDSTHLALAGVPAQRRARHRRHLRPPHAVRADPRRPGRGGRRPRVSPLREQLKVAASPATLRCKKIAVGEEGGFATGAAAVHRALCTGRSPLAGASPPGPARRRPPRPTRQRSTATSAFASSRATRRPRPTSTGAFATSRRPAGSLPSCSWTARAYRLGLSNAGAHGMAEAILRQNGDAGCRARTGAPQQVAMQTARLGEAVQESLERWLSMSSGMR